MKARTLVFAAVLAFLSVAASATTITFGGLAGPNGAVFTTYTESGFTVSPNGASQWCQGLLFGNPLPSLFTGPVCGSPTTTNALTVTEGGMAFMFSSLDIAANNGNTLFSIIGTLLGVPVFLFSGTVPGQFGPFGFTTVGSLSGLIDQLVITFSTAGSSSNLDNIVLVTRTVPEPGSLVLIGLGALVALAVARRRTRAM